MEIFYLGDDNESLLGGDNESLLGVEKDSLLVDLSLSLNSERP